MPNSVSRLCRRHFQQDDFLNYGQWQAKLANTWVSILMYLICGLYQVCMVWTCLPQEATCTCSHKNILTVSVVVECCWFYGKRFLMFGFRLRLRPGATPRGNPPTDASIEMDNRERRRLIRSLKAPTQYVVAHRLCLIAVCVDCFIVYCWTYLYVQRLQDCWYLILYTNVVFPICWCYAD